MNIKTAIYWNKRKKRFCERKDFAHYIFTSLIHGVFSSIQELYKRVGGMGEMRWWGIVCVGCVCVECVRVYQNCNTFRRYVWSFDCVAIVTSLMSCYLSAVL